MPEIRSAISTSSTYFHVLFLKLVLKTSFEKGDKWDYRGCQEH